MPEAGRRMPDAVPNLPTHGPSAGRWPIITDDANHPDPSPDDRMTPGHRPTLEQVAAHAGVSRATVSRVVNRSPSVDPHLVDVVSRAIRELGYVPNSAARALMTRRSSTVALVAAESRPLLRRPFFAGHRARREPGARRAPACTWCISMARTATDLDRVGELRPGRATSTVSWSSPSTTASTSSVWPRMPGSPSSLGGRPLAVHPEVVFVDHDNAHVGRLAAEDLRGRGRAGTSARSPAPRTCRRASTGWPVSPRRLGADHDPLLVDEGDFTTAEGRRRRSGSSNGARTSTACSSAPT